jgi:GMP synthase-like glutamine amidotransferase
MQIIGLIFKSKLVKNEFIGMNKVIFKKEFLGIRTGDKREVYQLHQMSARFSGGNFFIFNKGKIPQAIKHKLKPIYGVLFHPEVRNQEIIESFLQI